MATPPLERWAEDEALRELARLARDLPVVDADDAWRRLGRLTAEQRALVNRDLDSLPPPGLGTTEAHEKEGP